jgi:perosamine synthetase
LARPWIGEEEQARVARVLASGMLVQGAEVEELEARLAERCARRHAIACSSGTSALELALEALDVSGGDVLCPALSWPSPAHAIARRGATPILCDVDEGTWNTAAQTLASARTEATVAAIVIDQFGNPADVPAIEEALSDEIPLIVDAACSLGATLRGRPAGSFGAIACMSFHPRKLITTGEGGVCLTDDDALAERLRALRNHGQIGGGRFGMPAGNHRMTEMAAAIGVAQMDRLDAILERRGALAARYAEALTLPAQAPPEGGVANHQTYGVLLPSHHERDEVVAGLRADGVEAGRLSYALHEIHSLSWAPVAGSLEVTERVEAQGLALPMHPLLTHDEQDRVIAAMRPYLP